MEADKKRPRHEVIERYHKLRAMAEQKEEPHLAAKSKRLMEKMRVDYQLTDAEINPHQKQYQFDINNLSKEEKELLLKGAAVLFATRLNDGTGYAVRHKSNNYSTQSKAHEGN